MITLVEFRHLQRLYLEHTDLMFGEQLVEMLE